jgi:hypothetical protein
VRIRSSPGRPAGRNIEPVPVAFTSALALALELAEDDAPVPHIVNEPSRHVILVDTYELLAPLDNWLRESFLPQLPHDTLMVLAGRHPPSLTRRFASGWQDLVHTLPLNNLSDTESQTYLTHRSVPQEQHATILDFTHGHPLALSMVADLFSQDRAQGRAAKNGGTRFERGGALCRAGFAGTSRAKGAGAGPSRRTGNLRPGTFDDRGPAGRDTATAALRFVRHFRRVFSP